MTAVREAVYSIYGSYRLARLDRAAVGYFERTPEGFWRSFRAAVIVLPLALTIFVVQIAPDAQDYDIPLSLFGYAVHYVHRWLLWPVLMSFVVEMMSVPDRFVDYVVVLNWSSVLTAALFFVAFVFGSAYLPDQGAQVLLLVTIGVILVYRAFIAMATLGCAPLAGAGIALGELMVDYLVLTPLLGMLLVEAQ